MKVWLINLFNALIFTFVTIYWFFKHLEDTFGIIIFIIAGFLFYLLAVVNWRKDKQVNIT
ncbi:hypothetical protein AKJ37_06375 [candidate division MSBL1 archaeon SCGC-AAA259I09]|uniref:Uncharacterized protein n=3 Tax=candidate division MSBL1 TaxID=215777 RepID=A0A133UP27_9EURY|nr:hypothetical protein AKJ66_03335 [candidate division MSBL1 archaeon SCGC-AAA259E22]KXA95974.1 hypothetical protein AKJ37_06375 [candidate division MSBL1 archaeon SCGC-AAA259I09]KXA99722.1 hypothetical protein AKJ40_02535 [candidate division MSBL1 archaeon SCGC-AAA259M10]